MIATGAAINVVPCKGAFTMHVLDLNESMVASVDCNLTAEDNKELDRQIDSHWIFNSPTYAVQLKDLVLAARRVHTAAGILDERTDKQLAARMLRAHNLWDIKEPHGIWDHSKFFAQFACAYGRLTFGSDVVVGRMARNQPDHD